MLMSRVYENSKKIKINGIYKNWGCAVSKTKLTIELVITQHKKNRCATDEEKEIILKNCIEDGLIFILGVKNKTTIILLPNGDKYMEKKEYQQWFETYLGVK